MKKYPIYWGEMHDNTYQAGPPEEGVEQRMDVTKAHLDFYCGAYYPYTSPAFKKGGHPSEHKGKQELNTEHWKDSAQIASEWSEYVQALEAKNKRGEFITFAGYEWQGDGTWGDHNVFLFEENPPLFEGNDLAGLYAHLEGLRAIAIPHHTAYIRGYRGKDWSVLNEKISPFVEVFSIHGSSEGDNLGGGLRSNPFLGPDVTANSISAALKEGKRLGIIASTDNWGALPGHYGRGLAAAEAEGLTREALWEAFSKKQVYGVTGDRIKLWFEGNGQPMGSALPATGEVQLEIEAEGQDALASVELIKDEEIIHVFHPALGASSDCEEYKVRLEFGWGPAQNVLSLPEKEWEGHIRAEGGKITEAVPAWITEKHEYSLTGEGFHFTGKTGQETILEPHQNGYILTIKGNKETLLSFKVNGMEFSAPVSELTKESRILWDREESVNLIEGRFDCDTAALERKDVLFGMAYKVKIHRAVPETAYKTFCRFTDSTEDKEAHSYRVRVIQRNGQMAWSSPIWTVKGE